MASTGLVCDRLLADIISTSAQRVSDNFVVKVGLNRTALTSQDRISCEMVLQAGVKSEHCTIQREAQNESQPEAILRDEYMYRSMKKISRKRETKANIQSRRQMNSNKNKSKTDTVVVTRNQTAKEQILQQGRDLAMELQSPETKKQDKMRSAWFANQTRDKQDQVKAVGLQSVRDKSITKAKTSFKKETANGSNEYTYDHEGQLIFYPKSNISKQTNPNYPLKLNPQISQHNLVMKRIYLKPKPKLASGFPSPEANSEHKLQSRQDTQFALKISPQSIYNNNHQRQTSSVNYLHVKPGICYTEPSIGKSVRAESTKSDYLSTSRAKKSTFAKFFNADPKSKTDGFSRGGPQSSIRKYSYKSNMDLFKKTEGFYLRSELQRKSWSVKSNGCIVDINEQLLERMVSNQ